MRQADSDPLIPGILSRDAAAAILNGEDMYHPPSLFTDPSYAELELVRLAAEFDKWQRGRAKPIKAVSRRKYQYSLDTLFRSMTRQGIPLELRYLHPSSINAWVSEYRELGKAESGIASTLMSIKVFAHSFVYLHAELTIADPLRKVPRITAPDVEMDVFDVAELEQILASFGDITFEDVRNRAFMGVLISTGVRLRECRELSMNQWDPVATELTLHGKGDKIRYAKLADRASKYLRHYLRMRPKNTSNALWLTREGYPITDNGWQTVFRRLKRRCGVPRVRAHLFRHTFGTMAINKGAERAAVQDMMGHETDLMTRRYTREARKRTASAMMPSFSPI